MNQAAESQEVLSERQGAMARKRDAPTLIEVMGKDKPMHSTAPVQKEVSAEAEEEAAPKEVQQEFVIPDEPSMNLATRQIQLSGAKVAIAVVVLSFLTVGTFWLGHMAGYQAGQRQAQQEMQDPGMEKARSEQPDQDILGPLSGTQKPSADNAGSDRQETAWVNGYTYIRAQDFEADALNDAKLAQEYLDRHGIETVLVKNRGERVSYSLVTTRGFDRDDPAGKQQADQYLNRIHEIGQSYFENGGRYELEGYFVKLTRDSW